MLQTVQATSQALQIRHMQHKLRYEHISYVTSYATSIIAVSQQNQMIELKTILS